MDTLLALAISKLTAQKSPSIAVGVHKVKQTITLVVDATITKLADEEYTPTVSIPVKATMALLLQRMGLQRDKAMQLLTEAMTEALTIQAKGEDALAALTKNVEDAEEMVMSVTAALPKATRSGKTSIKGTVEVEERELVAA